MQDMQINPATIITQAILTSLLAGTASFVSSVVSGLFIQPMVHNISQQVGNAMVGGLKSLTNDDAPPSFFSPDMLFRPPVPPLFFSFSPDGQLQISVPMDKAVQNLMPFLNMPYAAKEGE